MAEAAASDSRTRERPIAGRCSTRLRAVSACVRAGTRKQLQTKTLTLILTPTIPDTSDTETDTERSVGNTWVWKGARLRLGLPL